MLRYSKFLSGIFISAILTGCNSDSDTTLEELNKHRQIWESQNISDYEMQFTHTCNCLDEVTAPRIALVENNEVVSQVATRFGPSISIGTEGLGVDSNNNKALRPELVTVWTVDELFDLIALEESRADFLEVEYTEGLGYPTLIRVDRNKQIADDEYSIKVDVVVPADQLSCAGWVVDNSLQLTIIEEGTYDPIGCRTTVTVSDEAGFTETFVNDAPSCEDDEKIAMLGDRNGFYQLTIEKAGYDTLVIEDFGIGRGMCGTRTRDQYFTLSPQ
ncbi:MAG: hypothetical protein GYB58_12810 [Gammaproteobacteria bacterium]|nr:hypothetical protein [Gammaproteobacteria bacterium]